MEPNHLMDITVMSNGINKCLYEMKKSWGFPWVLRNGKCLRNL